MPVTAGERHQEWGRRSPAEGTIGPAVGTGGGGGDSHNSRSNKGRSGEGGGFGLSAKPVGAYVIKDGQLRWQPAIDVNRLLTTLGAIAVAALFAATRLARLKARGREA